MSLACLGSSIIQLGESLLFSSTNLSAETKQDGHNISLFYANHDVYKVTLDCGVGFWYVFNTLNMQGELGHVSHKDGDGGMVRWWEHLPSTNVALASHVG